jgi:hypothetical protein
MLRRNLIKSALATESSTQGSQSTRWACDLNNFTSKSRLDFRRNLGLSCVLWQFPGTFSSRVLSIPQRRLRAPIH